MILFSQLDLLLGGEIVQMHEDAVIKHLLVDSRKAISLEGSVFFAIAGDRHNGHAFVQKVYDQGIRYFVVEKAVLLPRDANIVKVNGVINALRKIGALHRSQFNFPLVGITGSNGKTIIKEWLYQLLSAKFTIVKNPGSYNSQIGVPLSVWNMQSQHNLGLFEAGISKVGEMEKLATILQPTIGIFTNIGPAHDEGFTSMQQKITEKLKLFTNSQCVIYCKDHTLVNKELQQTSLKTLSWGYTSAADIHIVKSNSYELTYKKTKTYLSLPFTDAASIENCFHCIAAMLYFNMPSDEIKATIFSLQAVHMRLELKEGINQCQLVDDSYNNDLAGLKISLDFLNNQKQNKKKSLILSDILQTGVDSEVWINQVASLIKIHSIEHFVGIGKDLFSHQELFSKTDTFYKNTNDFLAALNELDFQNEIILIKGARSFTFERIVQRFQQKIHGTILEIDLGAMVHNLNFFRSILKPETKIMAMVKAFAYGSGSKEVSNLLQYHRVDYLGVAYADEGIELRKNFIRLPIMVMNPSPDTFDSLLRYQLEPVVYNVSVFSSFLQFLQGRPCSVHIEFDTGMHRLGFSMQNMTSLLKLLQANPNVTVASMYSHLAGADEEQHDTFSAQQANLFHDWAKLVSQALGYKPLYHLLNSPGILRMPHYQFDMVRLGIGLYGINPTTEKATNLKAVATLKTEISQLHTLEPGDTVGYGRHGKIERKKVIATVAIGYADGYSRAFSKGIGHMLVNGKRAPVIGNVCMDMTMIDVTDIPVNEGDAVTVYGGALPIEEVASRIHTIPYEILTNTSERVKRVFVAESI
jgi:Alr-MurF fusion protein